MRSTEYGKWQQFVSSTAADVTPGAGATGALASRLPFRFSLKAAALVGRRAISCSAKPAAVLFAIVSGAEAAKSNNEHNANHKLS